jgi:ATP-binding cassette subfamily B protein
MLNRWLAKRAWAKGNAVAYARFIWLLYNQQRGSVTRVVILNISLAQCPALLAYLSQQVVNEITLAPMAVVGFIATPILLGGVYLLLLLGQHVGQALTVMLTEQLAESASHAVNVQIIHAAMRLQGLSYFDDPHYHDRRTTLEESGPYLTGNYLRFLTDMVGVTLTIASLAVVLGGISPILPLIIIVTGLPDLLSQRRAHRLVYEGVVEAAGDKRLRDYYRSVLLQADSAKEIRLYALANYFTGMYREAGERVIERLARLRKHQGPRALICRTLAIVGGVSTYLWAVEGGAHGWLTPGQLAICITATAAIQQQLARAAQTIAGHQDTLGAARTMMEWLRIESDLEGTAALVLPVTGGTSGSEVRFDDVWFRYPGAEEFALRGLSLELRRGQCTAIVGHNGSGKTTLVKLLCRLYDPQSGAIYFDGHNVNRLSVQELRSRIAVIFQDFYRFELTVAENIAVSDASDQKQRLRVKEAAESAGAHDFLRTLPDGYATLLGREFEGAINLSGGQWQRVALARALFRDASLLILDEPTAAVDIATEAHIYDRFRAMAKGKTSLLISHRFSTVRLADHIVVVENGRVVESGDHEGLIKIKGKYQQMFMAQAERYTNDTMLVENSR